MAEIFTWSPTVDPQGSVRYRILAVQFGDGYKQTMGDGIHNRIQTWPLTFVGKGSYIKEVLSFLDKHQGCKAFLWTPPLGEEGYYTSTGTNITAHGADNFTLTVTFEQVFKP